MRLALNDSRISNRMRYVLCKGYETDDALVVKQLIGADDRILECGSSIGFLSLYATKMVGVKDYAMVEANPELAGLVDKNYALNNVEKAGPWLNYAVCAADCELDFGVNKNFWSSSIVVRPGISKTVKVGGRTLESIVAGLHFIPNVLIMDIEGAEVDIPASHFSFFEKIIMEVHPKISGKTKTDGFVAALLSQGYRVACQRGSTLGLVRTSGV
ncbi:MAG: FkbM family methyltransferase [Gammaproteobacteria bacterium]